MAQEAVERTILNFYPGHSVRRDERIDYGQVDKATTLFYAHITYPVRCITIDEQPHIIGRWTTQPVVAIERSEIDIATGKPAIIALVYAADIRALPQDLMERVANRLNKEQSFDTLYEQLRSNPVLPKRVHGEWDF